jgi:hypothetical protein
VADGSPYAGDTPAEPIPGDHDADADGISRADDDAPGESEDATAEDGHGQNSADETSRDDDAQGGSADAAPEGGDGQDGAPSEAA